VIVTKQLAEDFKAKAIATRPDYSVEPQKVGSAGEKEEAIALAGGPGSELKLLLAGWPLRIVATKSCSCNKRAAIMDENELREPGWCEKNIDTIVGWLREEAAKRGLPFLDAAGRLLVKRAIRNARKKLDEGK
jgi:hypothetical protein